MFGHNKTRYFVQIQIKHEVLQNLTDLDGEARCQKIFV